MMAKYLNQGQMFELHTVPAYCRTYNSKAAVWADWNAGKDFQVVPQGSYINKEDAAHCCLACIFVRYGKNLQKSCSINLIKNRMN